ncbi:MAG: glutamate synthase [Proteobacteria bacterium]|nr:glutamate synthase [Pseudomonadota bacterium]
MQDNQHDIIDKLLASRAKLPHIKSPIAKCDEEGGCGVTGFISSIPVAGRHIYEPSVQMHNRGNGKGGGIAAVGLSAESLGVSQDILDDHYLLQVAYLDPSIKKNLEDRFVTPVFDIHSSGMIPTIDDYTSIGLEVKPPDVCRYFVRVKPEVLSAFIEKHSLQAMDPRKAEDEFISQNTHNLNDAYYASLGDKQAFVMSHGRNIMILKVVGYAEQATQYYCLEDFKAHGWIAHQRYPTRGRLWHPGGAHPFSGLNEALVHNGDFANYHAVSEYLKQYQIYPQFLTDTELSVHLLDLYNRTFEYPLEYIIEAIAPTSEYDFDSLTPEKQHIYRHIQSQHTAGSPDGPWFFIIARNDPYENFLQLIGITDTAMLRPQVFALLEREEVQIGLICSEKQAIDATLQNLAKEDPRFCPVADKYWNARGGSATDGGAFTFTIRDSGKGDGSKVLVTENKFGERITVSKAQDHLDVTQPLSMATDKNEISAAIAKHLESDVAALKAYALSRITEWGFESLCCFLDETVAQAAKSNVAQANAIELLSFINDRRYSPGKKKLGSVLDRVRSALTRIFTSFPKLSDNTDSKFSYIDWDSRDTLRAPQGKEEVLAINAYDFEPEGPDCDSRLMNKAFVLGWKHYICFGYKGQRFTGCGFGPKTDDVTIHVYDSSGDYIASGIDGMELQIHGNAQDQLGQIMKNGKLVIHGDVGQTFMYGAKGGNVYIMGNAAGRPLINATGHPRVVINGTCLDYLAESFMAGDPLNGGGFVILNGMEFDEHGIIKALPTPYPGSNLFSLASGGAIYMRDPKRQIVDEQLNGGRFATLTDADWALILPYLEENERHFGISIQDDLLTVDGEKKPYSDVYIKVETMGKIGH